MQLIVVRHAKTNYNEKELINGSLDDDRLSSSGLAQIPTIITNLTSYNFNTIYTSPMHRSLQTAKPVAEYYKLQLITDARISEVNLGSFNGKGWDATIPALGLNSSQLLSSCEYI
jgi:broad specificity phosphatase PhoE